MNGDFFTFESFSTLAGASFGVVVISNVMQHVFNFNPKWFGLILAFIFSFLGAFLSYKTGIFYILAFLNGFLVYANAVGIVQVMGKKEDNSNTTNQPYGIGEISRTRRTFRTKWY